MQRVVTSVDDLAGIVAALADARGRVVIGVSGYGGAGKTTLVAALVKRLPSAVRLRGDDFLDPDRVSRRSTDWDGVLRQRMRAEAIEPFRAGEPVRYRLIDWTTRVYGEQVEVPTGEVLIVDCIGLFHPEMEGVFDLTVWVDADIDAAMRRGIARDRERGWADAAEWEQVWTPNDRDYVTAFEPHLRADVRYVSAA